MANVENTLLNLGSLRSQMRLTLHTHHAARMWRGRPPKDGVPGIIGLNGFLAFTNKMARFASQDDPYADWWLIRVEEKLSDVKTRLAEIKEQLEAIYVNVPAAMSLGENLNLQPANIAIFANSPLGFLAIFLLAEFDEITRQLVLAHHTALIDRNTLDRYLDHCSHHLRSLFTLVQRYRDSQVTREDFAAGNTAASTAIEKFGEIPADILNGTRRSRFAPPIYRREEKTPVEPSPDHLPDQSPEPADADSNGDLDRYALEDDDPADQ
ncbi:hypothetical protein CUZ56_00257 [Saezia sanguinis]|uniref:Integrating conjugative element protein n=1 Tax=Saezia sanguinis TaxID=1965230 RepID=A0A433SGE3_9BURK|nr:TIGR03761 family integrating conjugative element protein [Saezia sanguinis]RUS67780.1 hypothetical protein CUZ56_00257 [Saezia sanguinis]